MLGRTLTHYKVVAELGAGGMGVVYEAVDLRLDRRVALKVLPPDKGDDEFRRARFLHEARTASALNDPHIVTIFDIFTVDGTDVLVMELVPGQTLRQILDKGPLPLADALDIAIQVAEGVGAAHAAGIVHRDLKPGNVMVTARGRVKVLDFGLAKQLGDALADQATTMATVAGMLMGTVDYMSPEQARGDTIDARSDVFSLGAMLYEMVAGVRPFTSGHSLGVLHEIVSGTIVPLRARRPDATVEMERVVSRALERDLTARYQTMEACASDLRRARRSLLAGAAETVELPAPTATAPVSVAAASLSPAHRVPASSAPVVTPPPLPLHNPAPPPRPADSVAATAASIAAATASAAGTVLGGTTRRRAGKRAGKRSRWKTIGMVLAVVWGINWIRESAFDRPATSIERDPVGDAAPFGISDAVGEGVASGLQKLAPASAEVQLVSAKLYWENAQRSKAPADIKKAEDAFNEALRLGLQDENDLAEAQRALREIAEMKKPAASVQEPPAPN